MYGCDCGSSGGRFSTFCAGCRQIYQFKLPPQIDPQIDPMHSEIEGLFTRTEIQPVTDIIFVLENRYLGQMGLSSGGST